MCESPKEMNELLLINLILAQLSLVSCCPFKLVAYLPHHSLGLSDVINVICWLAYLNSCCNVDIYGIFHNEFRAAFYKFILRRKITKRVNDGLGQRPKAIVYFYSSLRGTCTTYI
jgi:hypothetical protein